MNKKTLSKRLQNKADRLCYEYTFKRDGGVCQVRRFFPQIAIAHTSVKQSDHCFSRSIKEIFLNVANRTLICSACNAAKGSGKISATKRDAITIAVHEIVKRREGIDAYNRLLEIAQRKCAFKDWGNPVWLEMQIDILKGMIDGQ